MAAEPNPLQIEMELAPNGQRILCYVDGYQQKRCPKCECKKRRRPHKHPMPKRGHQRRKSH